MLNIFPLNRIIIFIEPSSHLEHCGQIKHMTSIWSKENIIAVTRKSKCSIYFVQIFIYFTSKKLHGLKISSCYHHMSHVTCHSCTITCHMSQLYHHMSQFTCHMLQLYHHMSHLYHHMSQFTCHMSHLYHHMSQLYHHMSHVSSNF